ncbi:MAG TPA: hypothetical protein VJQ55_01645 [Candidatus Binatia bacterium]|nr:hypothetical protein [Candidatus Binatia bacterium]
MKVLLPMVCAITVIMFFGPGVHAAAAPKNAARRAPATIDTGSKQAKLLAERARLIDRKKAVREQLQKSMSLQDEKILSQSADYETKKELYEKNLISKSELDDSERILATTRQDTERMREWITEDDRALALAAQAAAEDFNSASGAALIRYDGGAAWSLTALSQISAFFRQRFGRALPISAMGQSDTHDRLGLDHRDSVDVAVRPDSTEGRDLMAYLRRRGVPFTAFRGKLSSMSTGAHIHIGHPSPRLSQSKAQVERVSARSHGVSSPGSG